MSMKNPINWTIKKIKEAYTDKIAVYKGNDYKNGNEFFEILILNNNKNWSNPRKSKIRLTREEMEILIKHMTKLINTETKEEI